MAWVVGLGGAQRRPREGELDHEGRLVAEVHVEAHQHAAHLHPVDEAFELPLRALDVHLGKHGERREDTF